MPRRIFFRILLAFLALTITFFITGYFFARPIALFFGRAALENLFKNAETSIKGCDFKPGTLLFYSIEIKKGKSLDIKIEEAAIAYNLKALVRKKISRVSLKNVSMDIKPLKAFSAERIDALNLKPGSGKLYIPKIDYDNFRIGEIKSDMKFGDNVISMNPVDITFLGGRITGNLNISVLSPDIVKYDFNLKALNLDIRSFVEDFKLIDKFEMTGKLGGAMSLAGMGASINEVNGTFLTDSPGGVLVIKDTRFLENVSKNSGQPLDIIVESFRNYNYNSGIARLFVEAGSLVMDVKLDGKTGKRNLALVLHDFSARKEKP
ncbi:MAG: YdbH domain-containing protein [Candidatus Omnitrophota bacterium]|jgi:hypothetical protein